MSTDDLLFTKKSVATVNVKRIVRIFIFLNFIQEFIRFFMIHVPITQVFFRFKSFYKVQSRVLSD